MADKKKPAKRKAKPRQPRRDVYSRVLADAERRIERYTAELAKAENRCMFLRREIPRLTGIVSAVQAQTWDAHFATGLTHLRETVRDANGTASSIPGVKPDVMKHVPEHLKRFVSAVATSPIADIEDALPEPDGVELIP